MACTMKKLVPLLLLGLCGCGAAAPKQGTWSGKVDWISATSSSSNPMRYVTGRIQLVDAPKLLEYEFGMGLGDKMSHVKIELTPESEAVKVVVTNDGWSEGDPTYLQNADGWPRILSRLKTLLETGKTFRPH